MKRSASGRVSLQSTGALKPRNEPFTPNNRESGGPSARKRSYIPKAGLGGSASRLAGRKGRASTENIPRLSFASSRFTPTHSNTPSRLITDSARNSGIGTSTRKDVRCFNEPRYKTQCVDKILDFLTTRGKSYQRRVLLTPTTNDFKDIFNFIYQHLDPSYTLPPRFEEEIPKILKNIRCPFQLTKSSFVTVGSPHTWPVVLAALAFMVDFVNITIIMDSSTPEDDLDYETGNWIHTIIEGFNCSDEAEEDACLEAQMETMKVDNNVSDKDMVDLAEALEAAEHELESLPKVNDELKHLKQCNIKYSDDLAKLNTYLKDLKIVIQNKSAVEESLKQSIMKFNTEESKLYEEIKRLKSLRDKQAYSTSDLMRLKNHGQLITKEIEYEEHLRKVLCNQVYDLEIEISKFDTVLRNSADQLKELLEKLSLNEEFAHINLKSEDVIHQNDDIKCILTTLKKAAKNKTSQTQEDLSKLCHDIERAKGLLQERIAEGNKLKTKIRHLKEESKVTQEEIKREAQLKEDELEELHRKIMEARKPQNKPVYNHYQLDDMISAKKQELGKSKKKEEMCLHDGLQFQKNFSEEGLQHAEVQRKLFVECTTRVKGELTKLLEWLDSVDMN